MVQSPCKADTARHGGVKIQKLHFNYFSRRIELDKAVFYNTDTVTGVSAYRFSVDKMQLQVKAFLPLVFKKQILIDSLTLQNPIIEVTRLRIVNKPGNKIKKDVSIPEEMGKVYSSIQFTSAGLISILIVSSTNG